MAIIQNIGHCDRVGVVESGVFVNKTNLMPMDNATKAEFEKFIGEINPQKTGEAVNFDTGLIEAENLLNSTSGKKEIIVFSDGLMPKKGEGFDVINKTVIDLKDKEIKIQFVQLLNFYENFKEPNMLYDELAQATNGKVIILNPDERISILVPSLESNESCLTQTSTPTPIQSIVSTQTIMPPSETKEIKPEKTDTIKAPGFGGIFLIIIFLIHVKFRNR